MKNIKTIGILFLITFVAVAILRGYSYLKNEYSGQKINATALISESNNSRPGTNATDNNKDKETETSKEASAADDETITEISQDENVEQEDMNKQENKSWAEIKLENMTLHEKICQMIVTWPEQIAGKDSTMLTSVGLKNGLKEYPVGGIILFAANIDNPKQIKDMISGAQEAAMKVEDIPLFVCVDEEGGNTLRIAGNSNFDIKETKAMSLMKDEKDVYESAQYIGSYLSELGFNYDFAPDADVLSNPKNKIIGSRSFGTDPEIVSAYSKVYSDGLKSRGIISCYKHYPGHGSTEADTHKGFAYTDKTYEELEKEDIIPFMNAQKDGVDSIMVAHISVPNVIGDDTPCTLSKEMITDILRNKLGFEGLIVTDAFNMGAITQKYSPAEAAKLAIMAGNDILLMPLELDTAVEAITQAVENGQIPLEQIDASVLRILNLKYDRICKSTVGD